MATLTEQLNTMYTTTWNLRRKELFDQVFAATPFYYLMSKKGRIKFETGGRMIEESLQYAMNDTVKFIGTGENVEIKTQDNLTVSLWAWKTLTGHITRLFGEFRQNRGQAKIMDRVTTDIDNLKGAMIDKLENMLFGDGTADDGKAINGLGNIIPTTPAVGTVGGIDRAVSTWWRPQVTSMSAEDTSVLLLKRMRTMFNDCGQWGNEVNRFPDLLVTTQAISEIYEEEADEKYRISDTGLIDLGFGDQAFKGRPLVWSPAATSGALFFLNTAYLHLIVDNIEWMSLGEWLPIYDQPKDYVAHALSVLNVVCSNCQRQGKLHTIA